MNESRENARGKNNGEIVRNEIKDGEEENDGRKGGEGDWLSARRAGAKSRPLYSATNAGPAIRRRSSSRPSMAFTPDKTNGRKRLAVDDDRVRSAEDADFLRPREENMDDLGEEDGFVHESGPTPEKRPRRHAGSEKAVDPSGSSSSSASGENASTDACPSTPEMPYRSQSASSTSLFGDSPLPDLFDASPLFDPAAIAATAGPTSCKAKKCLLNPAAIDAELDFSQDDSLFERIPDVNGNRASHKTEGLHAPADDLARPLHHRKMPVRTGNSVAGGGDGSDTCSDAAAGVSALSPPFASPTTDFECSTLVLADEETLTSTPYLGKKTFKVPLDAKSENAAISQIPPEASSGSGENKSQDRDGLVETQSSLNLSLDSNASLQTSFQERLRKTMRENVRETEREEALARDQRERDQRRLSRVEKFVEEAKLELVDNSAMEDHSGPFFGLHLGVEDLFRQHRKISKLYEWQEQCLSLKGLEERKNLIYSLPTSGGKTLVAEILMLRELLLRRKDAVFVLPYVAIVQEKVRALAPFSVSLGFAVEEYAGAKGQFPPRKKRKRKTIFVCTIEKASSLLNSLIENGKRQNEIGLFVIDELHMLGDGSSRGALLETTLTKVLHCCEETQIVGMSATLSNIGDLQLFLRAEVYENDFRPVELVEYIKIGSSIYEVQKGSTPSVTRAISDEDKIQHSRFITFPYTKEMEKQDPDHLQGLVSEVIPEKSCLIFCASKKNCENVALMLCRAMPEKLRRNREEERKELYQNLLIETPGGICPTLKKTLPYGVAYHHSGLTTDERRLIEEAYSAGVLCLLTCTSTLAAGVNLPAKRVILRSPYVGLSLLSRSRYKQMVGRAGRAGIDDSGESYLIVQPKDRAQVMKLISGSYDACLSSLAAALRQDVKDANANGLEDDGSKCMKRLVLSCVGLEITRSRDAIVSFLSKTLLHAQREKLDVDVVALADKAIQELVSQRLIVRCRKKDDDDDSQLLSTPFTLSHLPVSSAGVVEVDSPRLGSGGPTPSSSPLFNDDVAPPVDSPVEREGPTSCNIPSASSTADVVSAKETKESDANDDDDRDDGSSSSAALVPDPRGRFLRVTTLGKAAYKGGVDLDWSQRLYDDLKANLQVTQSLNLECTIHLLYLVTPYDAIGSVKPQWMTYFESLSCLGPVEMKAAELIGVRESYLAMRARGVSKSKVKVDDLVVARFYLTLVLRDLMAEKSVWEVAAKFTLDRGFIQGLLQRASAFSICVMHFTEELREFWAYPLLFKDFIPRLTQCSNPMLNHLMEIPGVKIGRAKQLLNAGFKKIADVAEGDPLQLTKAIQYLSKAKALSLIESAKMILKNKVEALEEEAQDMKESNRGKEDGTKEGEVGRVETVEGATATAETEAEGDGS